MLTLRRAVPKFDGKISYEAYRASFDDLVGLYPFLTDDQRFQLLSSGLVGAPQSLLEDLTANRTFAALDQALRLSYSKPVHAWTEMQNLTTMKQDASETLEEWSTRVSRAAHRAYPDTPLPRVEEYAVQYFFIGLHSAAIRNGVAGLTCCTLQEALGACRLVRSRLPPQSGPAAKRVCLASVSEAAVEVAPVVPAPAAPAAAPSAPAAPGPSWQDKLSALTRQVEQVVRQTKVATDAGTDTSANGRVVTARVLRAQCVLESNGSMEATTDGVHTVPMVPVASSVVSPDGTRGSSTEEGRPMRVRQDLQHGSPPPGLPAVAMAQYPGVLREQLSKIHHLVRENTKRAMLRMKAHYDKFSTLTYFKPGDVALLYNRRRRRGAAPPGAPRPAAKTAERAARDRASWAKFRAPTQARRAQEKAERQRAQERAERQRAQQQQRREQQRAPRRPDADQVRQAAPRRPAADLSRHAAPRLPVADVGLQQQPQQLAPPQPQPDVLGQLVEGFNALAAQVHALHQRHWQQPAPQWPSWPQGPAGPPGYYRPF
ncbi:Translation initiation factor IF-2 [Frankliniella fusca]|uniref:Translation initiation factor IF-2 n=1 Tax=Frankliniella fusca TaxID=407009 RepID=A0AAE1HRE6_9NEOP|nr:Translation initiation factor IF-2 [Frankliniella fusca]